MSGLSVLCLLLSLPLSAAAADWEQDVKSQIEETVLERDNAYAYYAARYAGTPGGEQEIRLPADAYESTAPDSAIQAANGFEGRDGVSVWGNSPDYATWRFQVPADGLYELKMLYYPLKQTSRAIETAVRLDGEFPFCEAASVTLSGAYQSEYPIRQDENGNDYNAAQVEISRWYDESLQNSDGLQDDPYLFYLSAGEHTLTLYLLQETMALGGVSFVPAASPESYAAYAARYGEAAAEQSYSQMWQAEGYTEKSDSSIMPQSSRDSSVTVPFSYSKLKLNILSGENWNRAGQWVEWTIQAPEDGWYTLSFRYSQSYNKNMPAHRRLFLDGEVPFAEANCFELPYEEDWAIYTLQDGQGREMPVWLTKGEHSLRLEAVLGNVQPVVSVMEDVVYQLSQIYQKINMITGSSPDQYRDYNLQNTVPGLLETFSSCAGELDRAMESLRGITGGKGTTAGIMDVLAYQLNDMVKAPSTIPLRMSALNSNISSLSAAAEDLKSQALDLDYILISSPGASKPQADDNFFQSAARGFMVFLYSFIEDYNTFSSGNDRESITVWLNSGRDQAQVINRMIDDMFIPKYGIDVKLKLVDASLIQAFLSGNPPDSMIMTARGQPVNLAIRGALADLSKMDGFFSLENEFQAGALDPYYFNKGCYGLPDSQSFYMMFYRKDILQSLGLEVPKTWDDLYDAMRILHINNMDIGIPYAGIDATQAVDGGLSTTSIFPALLLQNGGEFYTDDGKKTALTSTQAVGAFLRWTNFYTEYDLPMTYDFYNRFRTGTMPIGIASYTMYNQLYVAAPEIRNLWEMTTIPGTVREDGSISITQGGSGTASVITSTSRHKEAAWKFLRWWTGAEAQTRYSVDIESVIGMAARYPTANKEAFGNIQWSRSEYEVLSKQWAEVQEVPELPGSYYTVRDVDNAFRSVVLNGKNAKEALVQYSRDIDAEIARKRGEFSLDNQ